MAEKSYGTWGSLWVCPVLPLSAFPGPVTTGFLLLPPTHIPSILFSFPWSIFLFVVLLVPPPVHAPCLCYHCLLIFSLILSGDFSDFSPPENHLRLLSNWTNTPFSRTAVTSTLSCFIILSALWRKWRKKYRWLHFTALSRKQTIICTSQIICSCCLNLNEHILQLAVLFIDIPYLHSSLASCRKILIKNNKGQRMQSYLFIVNIPIFEWHSSFSCFWALSSGGFLFTRTLVVCHASIQGLPYHWSAFIPTLVARIFSFLNFSFSWHRAVMEGVPLLLVHGLGNQFWTHVSHS